MRECIAGVASKREVGTRCILKFDGRPQLEGKILFLSNGIRGTKGTDCKSAPSGEANPSIEVATKLSDVLGVSLDYLVGKIDVLLDDDIVEKILTIQQLPREDKEHILFALEAMLRDAKARATYSK